MIAFLEALSIWLVDFLLLATLLLAMSLLARLIVRQPAGRVMLARGTWLGLAAIAALTALPAWPRYHLDEISRLNTSPRSFAEQPAPANPAAVEPLSDAVPVGFTTVRHPPDAPAAEHAKPLPLRAGLAAVWLVAFGLALAWIGLGLAQTCQLLRRATAVPAWVQTELRRIVAARAKDRPKNNFLTLQLGHAYRFAPATQLARLCRSYFSVIPKAPGLWASDRVTSAIALGALKPRIVLPRESVVETNGPAVRAALAHEWAHIRHGDLRLLALERLLLPLVFLHPLFWWLRRSVRLEQELLADAAAAGDRPVEYAEVLLTWAKTARPSRHRLAALAIWEHPSTLSRRVYMILHSKRPLATSLSRARVCALGLLLAPAVLCLSFITVRPLTAQDEAPELPRAATASPILPNPPPAEPWREPEQILLELLVLSVDSQKLATTGASLEDLIAEVTNSRCNLEGRVVVADLNPGEVKLLVDRLKHSDAVQVLSRPQIMTLDGQPAHVQIDSLAPILDSDQVASGKREQHHQSKTLRTLLRLRPTIHSHENKARIRLDISAESADAFSLAPRAGSDKGPGFTSLVSQEFKLTRDLKPGNTLMATESPAKNDRPDVKQQLLLLVSLDTFPPATTAAVVDSAAGPTDAAEQLQQAIGALEAERARRAKENASLRRQVEELANEVARLKGAPPTGDAQRPLATLTVYRLRFISAQDAADALAGLLKKSKAKIANVAIDARTNSLIVSVEEQYRAEVARLVEALDRATGDTTKASLTAAAVGPDLDRRTQEQLLDLDLAEAELDVQDAESELSHAAELNKRNAGTISQHELRQRQLKVERAGIKLRRVQVRMAALKEQP
ncbi:MAG: M56 family metallopeptidase [Pirellulales bacterium]